MRRDFLKMMGLGGIAAALAGCGGSNTYTWNQKLTLVVQTPDGEKSGSAISQVTATVGKVFGSGAGLTRRLRGEATVVDLGNGKFLFALLEPERTDSVTPEELVLRLWPYPTPQTGDGLKELGEALGRISKLRESRTVPREFYPLLVTFTNLEDPKTVKVVQPERLASVFGSGYSLQQLTLELSDVEPSDAGFSETIPWADKLHGSIGKGMHLPMDHIFNRINDGSFFRK